MSEIIFPKAVSEFNSYFETHRLSAENCENDQMKGDNIAASSSVISGQINIASTFLHIYTQKQKSTTLNSILKRKLKYFCAKECFFVKIYVKKKINKI